MRETLGHLIQFTPVNGKGDPIYEGWLVLIDTLNKTLQWRDHWVVQRMTVENKKKLEDNVAKMFPEFNWFSQYRAVYQGEPSSTVIWSTSEEEARDLFERMNINNDTIERI